MHIEGFVQIDDGFTSGWASECCFSDSALGKCIEKGRFTNTGATHQDDDESGAFRCQLLGLPEKVVSLLSELRQLLRAYWPAVWPLGPGAELAFEFT